MSIHLCEIIINLPDHEVATGYQYDHSLQCVFRYTTNCIRNTCNYGRYGIDIQRYKVWNLKKNTNCVNPISFLIII